MTERSRTEYSIVNIAASMGGYALNIILSFICRIVFAHQLSADYLGAVSYTHLTLPTTTSV